MVKSHNSKEFWNEFRRSIGGRCKIPCTVDGNNGDDKNASLFHDKYHELYNSVPYNETEMDHIKADINTQIDINGVCPSITPDCVSRAISRMKARKSDGVSGHSSDHLLNATPKLHTHLALLFSSMLIHGAVPTDMTISTLVPIPKNRRKSLNDSNNYRAIALSSLLGKTLDHILLLQYSDHLFTSDLQYGFKKCHSTTQCTFILKEVVQYYLNNDSHVNVVLLDASRAFDRVNYTKLFRLLMKRQLCPVITRFLLRMYTNQTIRVRWGACISPLTPISNGVKQGGVLSPILFTIYMDELLLRLKSSSFGCHIGNIFCGALGYADDTVLLAPSLASLDAMLQVCEQYAVEYNVQFNSTNSKHLLFGHRSCNPTISFIGEAIMNVHTDTHLGNVIGNQSDTEIITQCIQKFICQANSVKSHFKHVHPDVLYRIFKTMCMSLYG